MLQNPANLPNSEQNQQLNPVNSQQAIRPKKKTKQNFALKPQHLERPNGLQALYQMTKKLNFDKLEDNVQISMQQIATVLKTWHFQMMPRYSLDYFLQRCKALGDGKYVQAYMSRVRKIHKGEDQWGTVIESNNQQINQNEEQADNLNQNPFQNQQQNKDQGVKQKIEKALKLISQIQKRDYQNNQQVQQDEDSQDLFAQMQQRKRKKAEQAQKLQSHQQLEEQPYFPQGFQNNYEDQSQQYQ